MKTFKIAHLYYDLMNLFGENGNIRYLKNKLEEQNLNVEIHFLSLEDKIDFDKYDFYYIGTGSEENFLLVLNNIKNYKKDILKAIKNNKFFLVTGNALDLFGQKLITFNEEIPTLECFEYESKIEEFRIVGEQQYQSKLIPQLTIGFQNRNRVITDFKDNLFNVIKGTGYNPKNNKEGIKQNNFYGTYLLGPLLVRNPYFCDYIVKEICENLNIIYKEPNTNTNAYKAYHEYLKNFYEEKK